MLGFMLREFESRAYSFKHSTALHPMGKAEMMAE